MTVVSVFNSTRMAEEGYCKFSKFFAYTNYLGLVNFVGACANVCIFFYSELTASSLCINIV